MTVIIVLAYYFNIRPDNSWLLYRGFNTNIRCINYEIINAKQ